MHNSNTVNSVDAVTQNYFGFVTLCATLLQTQQTGDGLQIVLYAVMNLFNYNRFYQQLLVLFAQLGNILQNNNSTTGLRPGNYRQNTYGKQNAMHRKFLAFRRACFHNHTDQRPIDSNIIGTAADKMRNIHNIKHMTRTVVGSNNHSVGIYYHNAVRRPQSLIVAVIADILAQIAQKLQRLSNNDIIGSSTFKADGTVAMSAAVAQRKNLQTVEHAQSPFTLAVNRHVFLQHTRNERLFNRTYTPARHIGTNIADLRHRLLLLKNIKKLFIFSRQINRHSSMCYICRQTEYLWHSL